MVKQPPHLLRLELAVARERREFAHFLRDFDHALAVGVAQHRHHQAVRRVGGETDVVVLLEDQVVAVERGVEGRVFFSAATLALIRNASMVTLPALPAAIALAFSSLSATRSASSSVMSASSCWVTCGIIAQLRARLAPEIFWMRDSGLLDRAELGEIDLGPRNEVQSAAGTGRGRGPPAMPPESAALTNFCTSSLPMRPPRWLPATCARGRRRVRARTTAPRDWRRAPCRAAPRRLRNAAADGSRRRRVASHRRHRRHRRAALALDFGDRFRGQAIGLRGHVDRLHLRAGFRGDLFLARRFGFGARRRGGGGDRFDQRDQAAFGQRVAELDLHLPDRARERRRHFHRRLVRFERDQPLVLATLSPGLTRTSITGTSL